MQMFTNARQLLAAPSKKRAAIRDTLTKHCLRERESDAGSTSAPYMATVITKEAAVAAYSSAPGHFVTVSEKDRPSSGERKAMSLSLWMRPNSRRLWNDTTFNRALHQAHPAENLKGAEGGATALGKPP